MAKHPLTMQIIGRIFMQKWLANLLLDHLPLNKALQYNSMISDVVACETTIVQTSNTSSNKRIKPFKQSKTHNKQK